MLRQAPAVRSSEPVHDPLDHAHRPVSPDRQAGDVGRGQKGLNGVHIGVHPAIRVTRSPFAVPLIGEQPVLLDPEPLLDDSQRIGEQARGAGAACRSRARSGEHDERMLIGALIPCRRSIMRVDRGEPPAVLGVAQPS